MANEIKEYTKEPKVTLISFTPDPMALMCFARRVMHSPVPDALEDLKNDPGKWLGMSMTKYVEEVLLNDGMPSFLEYVNLTFKLENVSRNFTHQKVRDRIGWTYSQQSMRCITTENFADDGMYHMPETVENKEEYHKKMLEIQALYRQALAQGVSTQDARGLLPANIYTTITFSCSLRAFIACVNKRACFKVQGEYKKIADLMIEEVKQKIDPRIMKWIGKPCELSNYKYCQMKGENLQQYKEGKLIGKQNTDHCCPIFQEKFTK